MSSDIGIGKIIREQRFQDAIHIAVAPIQAAHIMKPGDHVTVLEGKAFSLFSGHPPLGVVDPFLTHSVLEGEWFYLFLFPGSISSLRHAWTHPKLDVPAHSPSHYEPAPDAAISEKWLRSYAEKVNPSIWHGLDGKNGDPELAYRVLLEGLIDGKLVYHGIDMHDIGDLIDGEELRKHAEIVLRQPINYEDFEYFSCTC